jgi:hypothetical protein
MATVTSTNLVGARGEAIFFAQMTNYRGRTVPYFYPQFLGDKHPGVDYLVSALDGDNIEACFFAQIKATKSGYLVHKSGKKHLKVTVKREELSALFDFPGPTYLFVVDELAEQVYFMAVNHGGMRGISSMPTDHQVTCNSLRALWDEVKDNWASHPKPFSSSRRGLIYDEYTANAVERTAGSRAVDGQTYVSRRHHHASSSGHRL